MTTRTVTLTDFLLARIAEDEAMATAVRDYRRKREPLEGDATDGYEWDNSGMVYVSPARVLAECEAKRRIVAWTQELWDATMYEYASTEYGTPQGSPPPVDSEPGQLLRLLALPYAEHPDYDESWRP